MDAKSRLRHLGERSKIRVDSNIPIRRYYHSGKEMLTMAKVYENEGNMESAYVLYLKYVTLFLEKIREHKDYSAVIPAEKKKSMETLKLALAISEEMKIKLTRVFEREHKEWLAQQEILAAELESKREQEEELNRIRLNEEKKKRDLIEQDHQFALWTQDQINRGLDTVAIADRPTVPHSPSTESFSPPTHLDRSSGSTESPMDVPLAPPLPLQLTERDMHLPANSQSQRPSISAQSITNNASFAVINSSTESFGPGKSLGVLTPPATAPTFDRSVKPSSSQQQHPNDHTHNTFVPGASTSLVSPSIRPQIPDRSMKPSSTSGSGGGAGHPGERGVLVPARLIDKFLALAKPNSDKNIETLGMLGGKLAKNRFTVTHLVIPKQSGKSDRCDLECYEELGEQYDKDDIIMVGWVHTHPQYDVYLSSVDMHNQYEYQNMLTEFVAIVCSIKFNRTGYLSLTSEGMEEIGRCDKDNFHPDHNSKNPPLFSEAAHVTVDNSLDIIVRDLR